MRPALSAVLLALLALLPHTRHAGATGASRPSVPLDEECPENKLCLYHPRGCLQHRACTLALSVHRDSLRQDGSYLFELSASYKGYVAVALAQTTSMGNDSVVECVLNPATGKVETHMSRNSPIVIRPRNKRLSLEDQVGVSQVSAKFENGVISCVVRRERTTTVLGRTYDLEKGFWVLQVAAADRVKAENIVHHEVWVRTDTQVGLFAGRGLLDDVTSSEDSSSAAARAPARRRLGLVLLVAMLLCLLT